MEITYQNKPDDVAAILRNQSFWGHLKTIYELSYIMVIWAPALLFNVVLQNWQFLTVLLVVMFLFWAYVQYQYVRLLLSPGNKAKVFPGDQTVKLTPSHIELRGERGVSRRRWSGVLQLTNAANHLLFFVAKNRAFVIPKRAFNNDHQAQQYYELAQSYRGNPQEPDPAAHDWETFLVEFNINCGKLWQQISWRFNPKLDARVIATGPDPNEVPTLPRARGLLILFVIGLALASVAGLLKLWGWDHQHDDLWLMYDLMIVLVSIYLVVFGISLNMLFVYFNELQRQNILGDKQIEGWIYEQGIGLRSDHGISFSHWKIIEDVALDYESIVIYDLKPVVHVVIPKLAFQNDEQFQKTTNLIVGLCTDAKNDDDLVPSEISDNPFQSPKTT